MKTFVLLLSLTLVLILTAEVSVAQEMEPKKIENAEWKRVVYIDYKPGKTNRALEIITNHYGPAADKAGTSRPLMAVWMGSGEYDLVLVWAMEGGIEDMNWEISPRSTKWRTTLNEMAGGSDKAQAIVDEYQSLIASISTDLGFTR